MENQSVRELRNLRERLKDEQERTKNLKKSIADGDSEKIRLLEGRLQVASEKVEVERSYHLRAQESLEKVLMAYLNSDMTHSVLEDALLAVSIRVRTELLSHENWPGERQIPDPPDSPSETG